MSRPRGPVVPSCRTAIQLRHASPELLQRSLRIPQRTQASRRDAKVALGAGHLGLH